MALLETKGGTRNQKPVTLCFVSSHIPSSTIHPHIIKYLQGSHLPCGILCLRLRRRCLLQETVPRTGRASWSNMFGANLALDAASLERLNVFHHGKGSGCAVESYHKFPVMANSINWIHFRLPTKSRKELEHASTEVSDWAILRKCKTNTYLLLREWPRQFKKRQT